MNEKEIDEYMAESKRLLAVHSQAIGEYLAMVEAHGGDPMTEASLAAYRRSVEDYDAMVTHLLKAQGGIELQNSAAAFSLVPRRFIAAYW